MELNGESDGVIVKNYFHDLTNFDTENSAGLGFLVATVVHL